MLIKIRSMVLNEKEIKKEAKIELNKTIENMAIDIIRESNSIPSQYLSVEENIDIIKHLIKRLDLQQLNTIKKQKLTNILLIILSIIMAIGSVFSILQFYCD